MKIAYSQWIERVMSAEERLEQLFRLFSSIMLYVNGDVDEAMEWMKYLDEQKQVLGGMTLQEFMDKLREHGLVEDKPDGAVLSPRGVQRVRQDALREIFSSLKKSTSGTHDTPHAGGGVERDNATRQYVFGDQPQNIDLTQTLSNAFARGGIEDLNLKEEDIEVYESENQTSCATVVLIDISHSMILYGEDRITPAKQVALALSELILTKFPKDELFVAVFGDEAREIPLNDLPFLQVGPFHTNTRAGLQLARQLLRKTKNVNKQIFMITDGKPSAIFDDAHRLYKNAWGLDPRIVNKTLDEATACRKDKITISTFMVTDDPLLVNFVEQLTQANRGRAYYANLRALGETVFVDYLKNRRKTFKNS